MYDMYLSAIIIPNYLSLYYLVSINKMSLDKTQCGSLDRASLKSVERFVRAMTVKEVLGCKSEVKLSNFIFLINIYP